MTELVPGVSTAYGSGAGQTFHDVVGVGNSRGAALIHGSRLGDFTLQLDGASITTGGISWTQSWQIDPAAAQEFAYEIGGISAETAAGGVRANVIPKEGGNRFSGFFFFAGTGDKWYGNNLTPELRDLGMTIGRIRS